MSSEIIELLCEYNKPIMLIASRNQIDTNSGYVMKTAELSDKLKTLNTDNIMVCRDHCGPYFLDSEKNLPINLAIEATKKTIADDIEHGFNLIHIDTSRCEESYEVAEKLIKFCFDLNPSVRFEFGTEENIGVAAGLKKYADDVAFAKQFPNMDFVVAQTGSLVYEDRQAGNFNESIAQQLVQIANENLIKLKEHNADYLTAAEIEQRQIVGIHAMNIAPQLGVIQTKLLRNLSARIADREWESFANTVYNSKKWQKWTNGNNLDLAVDVAGHYCFSSLEYKLLLDKLNYNIDFLSHLKNELFYILDLYNDNF